MGYECGIDVVKKFKDISFEEMINIRNYLDWKNNPWNFESGNYTTYEAYWEAFVGEEDEQFPGEPTDKEAIDFYDKHRVHNLEYWCSSGKTYLENYLMNILTPVGDTENFIGFNLDNIHQAMLWCDDQLDTCYQKQVTPVKGIKVKDEDTEIITRIDGVVVEDNDGQSYNIYEGSENLYFIEDLGKFYCFSKLTSALNVLEFLEEDGDSFIWFWRSY